MLALFSLFISSCEKEKPANSNAEFYIRYSYTVAQPNQGSGSGTGNIANGIVNAVYQLDPYLHGTGICQNGKWSYEVKIDPKTAVFLATQDPKTGMVTIKVGTAKATYTITITYTCPDGTSYSATVTITT